MPFVGAEHRAVDRGGVPRKSGEKFAGVCFPKLYGIVFGSGEDASLKVLDAVRRQIEGAKARALFEDWLVGRLSPAHAGREANDALVERSVSRTSF